MTTIWDPVVVVTDVNDGDGLRYSGILLVRWCRRRTATTTPGGDGKEDGGGNEERATAAEQSDCTFRLLCKIANCVQTRDSPNASHKFV